jgi:hypothetical protein
MVTIKKMGESKRRPEAEDTISKSRFTAFPNIRAV